MPQKASTALKFDNTVAFAYNKHHLMQYDTAVCDLQAETLRQFVWRKVKAGSQTILLAERSNRTTLIGRVKAAQA